jgi:hypothetical protein
MKVNIKIKLSPKQKDGSRLNAIEKASIMHQKAAANIDYKAARNEDRKKARAEKKLAKVL